MITLIYKESRNRKKKQVKKEKKPVYSTVQRAHNKIKHFILDKKIFFQRFLMGTRDWCQALYHDLQDFHFLLQNMLITMQTIAILFPND